MDGIAQWAFFKLIFGFLDHEAEAFRDNLLGETLRWASGIGLILLTLWILMIRVIGAIAVIVSTGLLASCISARSPSSQIRNVCGTSSLAQGTEQQRCTFEAVAKRCNKVDACLIKCWSQDAGKGIGGGCHHLCWSEEPERWVPPPEAAICKK